MRPSVDEIIGDHNGGAHQQLAIRRDHTWERRCLVEIIASPSSTVEPESSDN
jgi:hypothetical protein